MGMGAVKVHSAAASRHVSTALVERMPARKRAHRRSARPWRRQRALALARAPRKHGRSICGICGQIITRTEKWHVDHKLALADGGNDYPPKLSYTRR
jgi:hypothetical protein